MKVIKAPTSRRRGIDYWLMKPDGSGKRRIAYFNQPGHSCFRDKKKTAADCPRNPDGRRIAAYCQNMSNILDGVASAIEETNVMIELLDG